MHMVNRIAVWRHQRSAGQHPITHQVGLLKSWNCAPTLIIRVVRHFPHERTAKGQTVRTPSWPGPEAQGERVIELALLGFLPQSWHDVPSNSFQVSNSEIQDSGRGNPGSRRLREADQMSFCVKFFVLIWSGTGFLGSRSSFRVLLTQIRRPRKIGSRKEQMCCQMSGGSLGTRGASCTGTPGMTSGTVGFTESCSRCRLWAISESDPSIVPDVALSSRASVVLLPAKDSSSDSSFEGDRLRFLKPGFSSSGFPVACSMLAARKQEHRSARARRKVTKAKGESVSRE